jgi:hypothetical protein
MANWLISGLADVPITNFQPACPHPDPKGRRPQMDEIKN